MSLRINTNIASMNARRTLGNQQKRVDHAQAALSSGNRIQSAADDAAGLAISENMRGQIAGLKKAEQNAQNAQSLVQVGEGGLNELSNILVRVRELSVQSASDTVSESERSFLNQESKQLIEEFDRIAQTTKFGNKNLLNGNTDTLEFHVGANSGSDNMVKYDVDADATAEGMGIDNISLEDKDGARDSLEILDEASMKLGSMRANFGAISSRLDSTVSHIQQQTEGLSAAKSRIADADIAEETAELASAQVLQSAATSVLMSANHNNASALKLIG